MNIRRATRDDIKTISELSIKTYVEAFGDTFTPKELEERLSKRSVEFYENVFDKDTIFLAEEDGKAVGYVQFGNVTFDKKGISKDELEIQRIYVLADYQGKGIGKALIETALSDPRLKNARNIYLDVWQDNLRAQKLYRSYGFEDTGETADGDIIMVKVSSENHAVGSFTNLRSRSFS